jgi:hypothetical protein
MRASLLALPVLAVTLLLSTPACTPQDDPASTLNAESSSYKLDGQLVKCQAAITTSGMETGDERFDLVSVSLSIISPSEYNAPILVLDFERSVRQSNGPYQLEYILYLKGDSHPPVFYKNAQATLTETSRGLFSGTFSATSPKEGTVTKGIFANVRVSKDYPQ